MEAAAHSIEHNEVAQALVGLMRDKETWFGSWSKLLAELQPHAVVTKYWPANSIQLRNRVIRLSEDLRKCGLEWRNNGREPGSGRSVVEVRRLQNYVNNHILTSVT